MSHIDTTYIIIRCFGLKTSCSISFVLFSVYNMKTEILQVHQQQIYPNACYGNTESYSMHLVLTKNLTLLEDDPARQMYFCFLKNPTVTSKHMAGFLM